MDYRKEFSESSLSEEDIKNVSRWEIDRILSTVKTLKTGNSKKQRISDKEIDKILSEKFIPISQREFNISKNISDDSLLKSSDISDIGEKRHKTTSEPDIRHNEKSDNDVNKFIINDSEKASKNSVDFTKNEKEKEITKEIEAVISESMKKSRKRKVSASYNNSKASIMLPLLSFICLALCVILCIFLFSAGN